MGILSRIRSAWNVYQKRTEPPPNLGVGNAWNPSRVVYYKASDRSTLDSVNNRIAVDVSEAIIQHIKTDSSGRYSGVVDSGVAFCLNIDPNVDQSPTQFRRDIVMTMLEKGVVAVFATDLDDSPDSSTMTRILKMRTGEIVQWYPQHVKIRAYDENDGLSKEIILPKRDVAIIENPFYSVMNETNSTFQRLARKLSLLDAVDEATAAGKLDIVIQLPYAVRTDRQREEANKRLRLIEDQLKNAKYGIAYTDGTERITQLNRPAENNILSQIQYLTENLYMELGVSRELLNGTASEAEVLSYHRRIINPILNAITEEFKRKFLTKTAITQGQTFRTQVDRFAMSTLAEIAQASDQLSRNAIVSPNEIRDILNLKPTSDPKADELSNRNIPEDKQTPVPTEGVQNAT